MASYAVSFLLGLYPVPATQQYLLSSSFFPRVALRNPVLTATIAASECAGTPANGTGGRVFVQNVTIDGAPWNSTCFLDWGAFTRGATVALTLSDDIGGTCGGALPPSLSAGGFA